MREVTSGRQYDQCFQLPLGAGQVRLQAPGAVYREPLIIWISTIGGIKNVQNRWV
jgi:hypothetical protein